jgi:hypothetical protein
MPEAPGHTERNVEVGESATPPAGGRPIRTSPSEARPPINAPVPPATSQDDSAEKEKGYPDLAPIEKFLATFLGPLTNIIVRRAAAQAKNREDLFASLASTLSSEKDRKAFLARKEQLFSGAAQIQSAKETSIGEGSTQPAVPHAAELTPAAIRRASELLARRLGPVSRVLTERAAQRADSLRSLYLLLAEHLKDPAERARFLQEATYPDR